MLNELYRAADSLAARGIAIEEQHPSLMPMGKNEPLLIVQIDAHCTPVAVQVEPGEIAGRLARVCHGSQGASLPGFNLPAPLRTLTLETDGIALGRILGAWRKERLGGGDIAVMISDLYSRSERREFKPSQAKNFGRTVGELAGWLADDFASSGPELANFTHLLKIVVGTKPDLASFAAGLAALLARGDGDLGPAERILLAEWLFGEPKNRPVYLLCEREDAALCSVADARMVPLLNRHLLAIGAPPFDAGHRGATKAPEQGLDAFSGASCETTETFPEPKVAVLGNVRLFSNNSQEAACFFRYGLGGGETFQVAKATAQRMAGALLHLAGDDQLGKTCRAIPSRRGDRRDLLFAYLEDEPDAPDPFVDLFAVESPEFGSADFAATARPVLEALEAKVAANPNQELRLIAISPLDKANKQVTLNRGLTVREVLAAAKAWQAGAHNCPPVRALFFDTKARREVTRERVVPTPMDAAAVLDKVWVCSTGKFKSSFQRAMTVSEVYDIFLARPGSKARARLALSVLLARGRTVFAAFARAAQTSEPRRGLSDAGRWYTLNAVALTGILLEQLGERQASFMKEPTYQLGQLLAYADALHQQYCKHVRKGVAPTQLIGNALFATALEQPVFALARLAERLAPYQAWANTFRSSDPNVKSGWEKVLLRRIRECAASFIEQRDGTFLIRTDELPPRMSDVDKAKLLLGYLAEPQKPEPKEDPSL